MAEAPPAAGRTRLQRVLRRAMLQRVLSAVRAGNHTAAVARPSAVTHPAVTHLRQATPEEIADGATCRFCFDNTTDEKLIAPCACQGSQLWVHHACLVRWQKASMRAQTGHELVCSVCNTAYALPPPVMPPSPVRAGMLLVASADLHGTFHQSVILLCEVNARGAHGVIINYHIEPVAGSISTQMEAVVADGQVRVEWRRGGPVCGGRLGVVSYTVLHTVDASTAQGVPSLQVVAASNISEVHSSGADEAAPASEDGAAPSAANHDAAEGAEDAPAAGPSSPSPPLPAGAIHVAIEAGAPASFSASNLARYCQRLAKNVGRGSTPPTAICLMGHCRWGRGQLQGEIARGSWELCETRSEDVLLADDSMWQRLQASGRLIDPSGIDDDEAP